MIDSKSAGQKDCFSEEYTSQDEDAVMPIAIIGIGGRYPGSASNPQKLWELIAQGGSALTEVPKDRFNVDAFYHPHNERRGTLNARGAHFMDSDITAFDAPFFSISPAEAKAMDPQQRMALECAYEALENAGLRMEDAVGSNTSCYVGSFTHDYSNMLLSDAENRPFYYSTGAGFAILSNRISWFFDFKGPSISIDTACSSSLVALHLGCQSLRSGESEMSIVGGTNLMLLPDIMADMTQLHFLSPDSKCQSFDHKANGYSRGEGAAFVVLKPLHLALKNHDMIRGVIRNTAVNQDGNTPGITLPSVEAQVTLIRKAYADAELSFAGTAYVEAHGTGTPAGDPVEAEALALTFGKARAQGDPLFIGSVKSNIGHLEGASGLAQITKVISMLEKGLIPPNIWYEKPNARIPMEDWNLTVPVKLTPWPKSGLRRISINSFGYGGTNAHCIIDDAYHYMKSRHLSGNHNTMKSTGNSSPTDSASFGIDMNPAELMLTKNNLHNATSTEWKCLDSFYNTTFKAITPSPKLLIWSSHEKVGVERTSTIYSDYLGSKLAAGLDKKDEKTIFTAFVHTLASRRSVFPWKAFTIASCCKEACENLKATTIKAVRSPAKHPKLGFVLTGQGAQWYAMGRELCVYRVFKESLEAASAYLVSIGSPWSLLVELYRDEQSSNLNSASVSQPICTALQIALIDLLRSWGVIPAAVTGHSSGEIAAAYVKGAISKEDALSISYHRGRLSSSIQGFLPNVQGAMLATGLGPEDVQTYLDRVTNGNATIACINSPSSTTLSGDAKTIAALQEMLNEDNHFARRLKVDVAYHSPHMQLIAESYLDSIGNIRTLPDYGSGVKMFSCVTGKLIDNSDLGASYWVTNLLSQVNFSGAVQSLLHHSDAKIGKRVWKPYVKVLVEVGPHSALQGPLSQIFAINSSKFEDVTYVSLLQRGNDARTTALYAIGRLFQLGYPINISAVNNETNHSGSDGFVVDMPPFSWNRKAKYWFESHTANGHRFRQHPRKDLLGSLTVENLPGEPRYRNILKTAEVPWVEFHKVQGSILYPAAGMVIMAVEAAFQNADLTQTIEGYELRDILIRKAIVIPENDAGVETMLSFKPWRLGSRASNSTWQEFNTFSRQDVWELNCSGLIRTKYKRGVSSLFKAEDIATGKGYSQRYHELSKDCTRTQNPRQFYEQLTTIGLYYGDVFQNLIEINKGEFKGTCLLRIPDTKSLMPCKFEYPHVIHPATLDSIIQMAILSCSGSDEGMTAAAVPVFIGRLYISADMPSTAGTVVPGYAVTENFGYDDGETTVVVSNAAWDKPLIIIEDLKFTSLSDLVKCDSASLSNLRKLTSYSQWKEDVSKLEPAHVKTLCAEIVGDISPSETRIHAELEFAAFIYIKRVLKAYSLEEAKMFAPHLYLFYQFMKKTYDRASSGTLVYQSTTVDWLNTSEEFEAELLARVARSSADGSIMCEHGENLVPIMRGEIPPLQVLMNDNRLHNIYQFGIGFPQNYAQAACYVDLLAHKSPNMKILEIGGGTGGASLPILEALGGQNGSSPRFANYTFTDISVGFFEKTKEKLKAWSPFMTFVSLNIEEDLVKQGFEEGSFDLIVASNVLHATHSIDKTLANVRWLLKWNGKLVLGEPTNSLQKLRFTMIFGSLEGWWLGEKDGRHFGPTMTDDEWNMALIRAGFSGVDVFFHDFNEPRKQMLSVIVSTASPAKPEPAPHDVLIVVPAVAGEELQKLSSNIAGRLTGTKVTISNLQDTVSIDISRRSCLILLEAERGVSCLSEVSEEDWVALKRLILESADTTWVMRGGTVHSENPWANLMSGLARSIRSENPPLALATLDLDYTEPLNTDETVIAIIKVFTSVANSKGSSMPDWEFAIRNGRVMVQRILPEKEMNDLIATHNSTLKPEEALFKQEGRPLALQIGMPGRLDTLRFIDDKALETPLLADEVEIEVKAAGLNPKDVMIAMGQLIEPAIGLECSGIIRHIGSGVTTLKPGDKVMTWRQGTFSNFARNPESMCQLIPEGINFGTAASLPLIYSTAYYALFDAGKLQRGETILIHGAAGGVGQAAIILAQHIGAEVFATVSSEAKKQHVIKHYSIPEDHIFNSRDNSFATGVMRLTKQRGVDVVLNFLPGEALKESWRCIAWFGRFLEMGKKDITENTGLDMAPFIRNVAFHSINMMGILAHDVSKASSIFNNVMELLRQQVVIPVTPITLLPFSNVDKAFRLMQAGNHMGKIVLEVLDDDKVSVMPPSETPVRFSPNSTYLLAGGSGGLGRCLAQWMVDSGARNVVLLSRFGSSKASVMDLTKRLTKQGAKVAAYSCDIGNEEEIKETLRRCSKEFPPIRGVIQGAMVLEDSIFQNMTREQFLGATRCKVQGSWYLHKHLPHDLDFFILLSSIAGIVGSRGQGNYCAGNAYQDALAHYRRAQGLKACSINVGLVLGAGFLTEETTKARVHENTKSWSHIGIHEKEFLALVQASIRGQSMKGVPIPPQIITGLSTGGMMAQVAEKYPWWFNDAKFAHMKQVDVYQFTQDQDEVTEQLITLLLEATSMEQATEIVSAALVKKLAKSMMVPIEDIEASRPVSSFGIDSLLAVELRSWLFSEIQADISVFDWLSNIPISALARKIVTKSKCVPASTIDAE